jgi:hypothetical protein
MGVYTNTVTTTWADLATTLAALTQDTSVVISDPLNVVFNSVSVSGSFGYIIKNSCPSTVLVDFSDNDFSSNTNVTEVTSGSNGWFTNCSRLSGMGKLPSSLISGYYMFYGCTSLADIDLSKNTALTSGVSMFQNCTSLASVDLSNLTALTDGGSMFYHCTSLASIDLSKNTALTIGYCMFQNCTSLASVNLSKNTALTSGYCMFQNCTSLASIDLSKNTALTNGYCMFQNCTSLASIDLSKNNSLTNAYLMLSDCTALKKAFLHKYLFTFSGAKQSLTLTDCSSLTDIWIDDASVTTATLQGYGLPTTVTPTITYYLRCAFSDFATKFVALTANTASTPYHLWIDRLTVASLGSSETSGTLGYILNNGNTNSVYYLFDSEHTDFGVSSVTSYASLLKGCVKMTKFLGTSLNASCTSLSHAFDGCTAMTEFNTSVASSMTLLTDVSYMLNGCNALPSCSVIIPNSVTNMNSAFKGTLVSDTLVGGVASFPTGVTDISYCFYGDTAQDDVYNIPSTVTAMDYAYKGCTGITSIKSIPAGCSASHAFDGCTGITAVSCLQNTPSSLAYAFNGCTALKSVSPFCVDTSECTMTGCYTGCTSLAEIGIPVMADGVTEEESWKYVVVDDEAGVFSLKVYSRNLSGGEIVLNGTVSVTKKDGCDYIIMYGKMDELLFNADTVLDSGTILTMIKYGYPFTNTYGEGTDPSKKAFIIQAADTSAVKSNAFISVAQTIGFIYVQFPNQASPYSLFGGTWEDISSTYGGAFFRANGGNSAAFGTVQSSMIQSHSHGISTDGSHYHSFPRAVLDTQIGGDNRRSGTGSYISGSISNTNWGGSHSHTIYANGGIETRPQNYSVIIWKRTA